MSLSSIVNVQITRLTQSVSQAGFGTLMLLGTNKRFNQRIKYYPNMAEVAVDFRPYDVEYIAAQDVFAQSPAPSLLAIGRRTCDIATVRVITAMDNQDYSVKINDDVITTSSTPTAQNATLTFSTVFFTGNTIDLDVNGNAISQVTFTSNPATINAVAAAIVAADPTEVESATVDGLVITIVGKPNVTVTLTNVVVASGTTPPTATVAAFDQPVTNINIADAIATAINDIGSLPVTADASAEDGTFLIEAKVSGVPYTLDVFSNIANPNQAIVQVTQVEPNQAYTVEINKKKFTYTAPNDVESVEQIAQGLLTLIQADALLPVSADFDTQAQQTLIALDADLVTGNTIDITLNGVPLDQVTFSISHLDTMKAIVELLEEQPGVESAELFGATYRNIQVYGLPDVSAIVTLFDVNAGASQATATLTDMNQPTGSIILTSNVSTSTFQITVTPNILTLQKGLLIEPLVPTNAIETDLDAVQASSDDWYGIALTSRAIQDVISTANWTETRPKLFGTASSELAIIDQSANDDVTSLAYILSSAGYTRTFLMYHQDANDDFPECAWFGRCLPLEPGSETWKFKRLATISYSKLSTTQSINAQQKSANTYQFVGGFGITAEGTVSSGEFIDIIRGVDWLTARIQEFVFFVLVNNNKVPYTDAGIALIEAEVRRALELGVANNFLAADPQYTVTVPSAASVDPQDKANRLLKNVNFQATLAGAIHFVEIRGVVSV